MKSLESPRAHPYRTQLDFGLSVSSVAAGSADLFNQRKALDAKIKEAQAWGKSTPQSDTAKKRGRPKKETAAPLGAAQKIA